jgi:thiamine-monophosphate kinase
LRENAADSLQQKLDYPQPRIEAGQVLAGHASAVIDISDGLLADLGHLLEADGLGATVQVEVLPRSADFIAALEKHGSDQPFWFNDLPLGAGDDYELCFTVPEKSCASLEAQFTGLPCGCTQIGIIEESAGIRCYLENGTRYQPAAEGYVHFDGAEK